MLLALNNANNSLFTNQCGVGISGIQTILSRYCLRTLIVIDVSYNKTKSLPACTSKQSSGETNHSLAQKMCTPSRLM